MAINILICCTQKEMTRTCGCNTKLGIMHQVPKILTKRHTGFDILFVKTDFELPDSYHFWLLGRQLVLKSGGVPQSPPSLKVI